MRSIPWQKVMGGGALSRRLARIHLYLRGRTKVCWQHGRHVSELFHSPLCAFIVWQGRPLFYSRRFQRRWEPPTCNLSREAIFEEKRGTRVATPAIMGMLANSPRYTPASRNFTRLPPFFSTRNGNTMIFFSDFSLRFARECVLLWKKRPLAIHYLASCESVFLLRDCRERTYLAIIWEKLRWSFVVDIINGYLTLMIYRGWE